MIGKIVEKEWGDDDVEAIGGDQVLNRCIYEGHFVLANVSFGELATSAAFLYNPSKTNP